MKPSDSKKKCLQNILNSYLKKIMLSQMRKKRTRNKTGVTEPLE